MISWSECKDGNQLMRRRGQQALKARAYSRLPCPLNPAFSYFAVRLFLAQYAFIRLLTSFRWAADIVLRLGAAWAAA